MTYNVFGGMLNLAHSLTQSSNSFIQLMLVIILVTNDLSCLFVGVADGMQHVCIHQSYSASRGAGTLAGRPPRKTSSTTPADHLRNQCQVP